MARKIKVKTVLELRGANLSRSQIAATRKMSRNSVSEVFKIADEKGVTYSDVKDLSETEVYRMFFPERHITEIIYGDPDYSYVHEELKKTGVTLKLLHEEYVDQCNQENKIPMGRSKFNEGYSQYTIANKLTNHLEHKPGSVCEVDWSGKKMHYVDQTTGELIDVYLFVGTLPYSQYTYVEPCRDMKMDTFIRCHVRMYEFFGGVPTKTVCDNLKTGVVSHPREGEIILTSDYEALGLHYVTAIMPAGIKKPKQKASVEGSVGRIATAIIAKCRNAMFASFEDLKSEVNNKLRAFNAAPFQKRDGSRAEVWLEEKEYLRPLPDIPYEVATWVYDRKVGLDFHIAYKKNRYSCPYQYSGKNVDLKVTDTKIEIYYKDERLTTHIRFPDYVQNRYSSHPEDMPPQFKDITPWTDTRIMKWAKSIGPYTEIVVGKIFQGVKIKEQGYNPSLAVLRLSRKYSDARLESACELALTRGVYSPRYHHLNGILSSNQDIVYEEQKDTSVSSGSELGYLRGASYYKGKGGRGDA